jgi:hypothetical protein
LSITVTVPREYPSWRDWRYEAIRAAGLINTAESIEYHMKDGALWFGYQTVAGERAMSVFSVQP